MPKFAWGLAWVQGSVSEPAPPVFPRPRGVTGVSPQAWQALPLINVKEEGSCRGGRKAREHSNGTKQPICSRSRVESFFPRSPSQLSKIVNCLYSF